MQRSGYHTENLVNISRSYHKYEDSRERILYNESRGEVSVLLFSPKKTYLKVSSSQYVGISRTYSKTVHYTILR